MLASGRGAGVLQHLESHFNNPARPAPAATTIGPGLAGTRRKPAARRRRAGLVHLQLDALIDKPAQGAIARRSKETPLKAFV